MLNFFARFAVGAKVRALEARVADLERVAISDLDEVAKRLSASVLAGIRKEIAKSRQVVARPKVAVKKK